jgi:hypothetical protein
MITCLASAIALSSHQRAAPGHASASGAGIAYALKHGTDAAESVDWRFRLRVATISQLLTVTAPMGPARAQRCPRC